MAEGFLSPANGASSAVSISSEEPDEDLRRAHNRLSLKLEKEITHEQLNALKQYFYRAPLGVNVFGRISTFTELWNALDSYRTIKPGKYSELTTPLQDIGAESCLSMLQKFVKKEFRKQISRNDVASGPIKTGHERDAQLRESADLREQIRQERKQKETAERLRDLAIKEREESHIRHEVDIRKAWKEVEQQRQGGNIDSTNTGTVESDDGVYAHYAQGSFNGNDENGPHILEHAKVLVDHTHQGDFDKSSHGKHSQVMGARHDPIGQDDESTCARELVVEDPADESWLSPHYEDQARFHSALFQNDGTQEIVSTGISFRMPKGPAKDCTEADILEDIRLLSSDNIMTKTKSKRSRSKSDSNADTNRKVISGKVFARSWDEGTAGWMKNGGRGSRSMDSQLAQHSATKKFPSDNEIAPPETQRCVSQDPRLTLDECCRGYQSTERKKQCANDRSDISCNAVDYTDVLNAFDLELPAMFSYIINCLEKNDFESAKRVFATLKFDIRKALMSLKESQQTLLFKACIKGKVNFMEYFLSECGANTEEISQYISENGVCYQATPLWWAAFTDQPKVVQTLVAHDADVNTEIPDVNTSAVLAACSMGNIDIVKYLVAHGADLQRPNVNGDTCLHKSVHSLDLCLFLINHGGRVNAKDKFARTPLHSAVDTGPIEIVRLFARRGADVRIKDWTGETALQMARRLGRDKVAELLLKVMELCRASGI